jgi:hypothetical protein
MELNFHTTYRKTKKGDRNVSIIMIFRTNKDLKNREKKEKQENKTFIRISRHQRGGETRASQFKFPGIDVKEVAKHLHLNSTGKSSSVLLR